jgi:hypothetical protein
MRIIPDDVKIETRPSSHSSQYYVDSYNKSDTIEITDAEWDEIYEHYDDLLNNRLAGQNYMKDGFVPFSQYLRELISLTGEII